MTSTCSWTVDHPHPHPCGTPAAGTLNGQALCDLHYTTTVWTELHA